MNDKLEEDIRWLFHGGDDPLDRQKAAELLLQLLERIETLEAAESDKKANKNVVDDVAALQKPELAAKVQVKTTGGNAGLATQIVEIYDPLRERLQPGQLLYTEPPKREWVGLTPNERWDLWNNSDQNNSFTFANAVENKLRDKNA